MAAFSRVKPAGYAVGERLPSADVTALDVNLVKAPNFVDGGATYTPADPVVVGGDGIHVDGAGWRVLSLASFTVASGGSILVNGGGFITVTGSGGVGIFRVQSGGAAQILAGGALDVFGNATLKTSGPGTLTAETGSIATFDSGSTVNLTGATNIRGETRLRSTANGGPGTMVCETDTSLTMQAGSTLSLANTVTVNAATVITYASGSTETGTKTRTGREIRSGTGARTAYRPAVALSASADDQITVNADRYTIPSVLSGNRAYPIMHTGIVPVEGDRILVSRISPTTPDAIDTPRVVREDGTVLFVWYIPNQGFAEFEFDGTSWQVIAGAQYPSGGSGYYGDIW